MHSVSPDLSSDCRLWYPTTYPLSCLISIPNLHVQNQSPALSSTASQKICSSHTSPQLSKWTVCTAKILGSHKLYPIHQQILSTLPPQWPKPPWSLIKITATASCSGHFRAPCHVLLACQTSAQPWWTAPSTPPAFPPQAAQSLFIFCSATSAGSLQQPWSAEEEILPLRATFNQLG